VASKFHVTIVPVVGNAANAGDKWNPHTPEGRIQKELFGSDPEVDYLAATQPSPEVTRAVLGFVPGLNSALVFGDPKATTFDKTLAVGTDVLAVVGVGAVVKLGAKGVGLAKGVVLGAEAAEATLGSGRAYSVAFETIIPELGAAKRPAHFMAANENLLRAMADPEMAPALRGTLGANFEGTIISVEGGVLGQSPAGWTWHHVPDLPGVMQLVPRAQHQSSLLAPIFHPGGKGGFFLWGSRF
jgi:hypothetical protein